MIKLQPCEREIVIDVETTGLNADVDRIIEIGCVEIVNRKLTGRVLHLYVDPKRDIPDEVVAVHNLTLDEVRKLSGGRCFGALAAELIDFIDGSRLIAHNASFDISFLDAECARNGFPRISSRCEVVDSLKIAREVWRGYPNRLDNLLDRYGIDRSQRSIEGHGALLDAQLLAQVYLCLTRTQYQIGFESEKTVTPATRARVARLERTLVPPAVSARLPILDLSDEERAAHDALLRRIAEDAGVEVEFPLPG